MAGRFTLKRQVVVPRPLDEVFAFFARPENLERITPPWLNFRILTPGPVPMHVGARIDYRIRLRGIPLRWTSEITLWDPPHAFVDEQRRGPYRTWIHHHAFETTAEGTQVADFVRYDMLGGACADRLVVRADLERIFDYRRDALLRELVGGAV